MVSACNLIGNQSQLELRGLAGRLFTCTCEECSVHAQSHVRRQQRDESIGVLTLSLSSGARHSWYLREWRWVSDRAVILRLGAHKFSETLPEPCGEQAVDDGVDCWAEVEEDARHDVDVLINVMHQISPLADGTPQEPLDVEGRPADAKHCNHDC